jgi:beta-galactosidase
MALLSAAVRLLVLAGALTTTGRAQRTVASLNHGWKFEEVGGGSGGGAQNCTDLKQHFPTPYNDVQVLGLKAAPSAKDLASCAAACCAVASCEVYQFSDERKGGGCWIGQLGGTEGPCPGTGCPKAAGWQGRGRQGGAGPSPTPSPGAGGCSDPRCEPATDDSGWRTVNVPHDFVVEHDFSESMSGPKPKSHGYLPYGVAWYRKHFTPPAAVAQAATVYIDFDGIQTSSEVWLNGHFLGTWGYGYTGSRYFLNSSVLKVGEENVLAVRVDCTNPDGWWYDGGGIYRNVWFTFVESPGPVIAPWGVYCGGSNVTDVSTIEWDAGGNPSADGQLMPIIELWNNGSKASDFALSLEVKDASGKSVVTAQGKGNLPAASSTEWSPDSAMEMPKASLWHVIDPPNKPALYTLTVSLSVGGTVVDVITERFGVRATSWSNATGFSLNGKPFKILGNANHQDFPAVGVAVPDHLQWYRVQGQKNWGSNGWRTAHNPPTPALLDAMDELGYVSWDENHRNGQLDQVPWLIKRDRNHPSVVIWSICNEVLCNSKGGKTDALAMKALMHKLDPLGNRPVSANQNGWVGTTTPLDVQGFDYSTQRYDSWHSQAPGIPEISSETSSAVGDRGEYKSDAKTGHVSGYDTNAPGWGETAESAWGMHCQCCLPPPRPF